MHYGKSCEFLLLVRHSFLNCLHRSPHLSISGTHILLAFKLAIIYCNPVSAREEEGLGTAVYGEKRVTQGGKKKSALGSDLLTGDFHNPSYINGGKPFKNHVMLLKEAVYIPYSLPVP